MALHCLIQKTGNSLFSFTTTCSSSALRKIVFMNSPFQKKVLNFSTLTDVANKKTIFPLKSYRLSFFNTLHNTAEERSIKNRNTLYYLTAFTILVGGFTYSSVLLYRLYCQTTGRGGQAIVDDAGERIADMKAIKTRNIKVGFNADVKSTMKWNFKPQQSYIKVSPGETALAFYTALNPTDKPIIGVATYNVLPFEAGKYFNKIQCFCFEEQQLNPHEEVDMPVFFYLDPEYAEDPRLENVNDIVLSYTFFEAKEGMQLPRPSFV